jgi:hypothetical protein
MPRGQRSNDGDRTVNRNGYEATRVNGVWVGSHILLMEEHLGRKLLPGEYVAFKNGHKPPVTIDMIELRRHGDRKSRAARTAAIEERIEQLQAELDLIRQEVE